MRPLVTPTHPSCSPFILIFCVLVNPIMLTLSLPPLFIQTDAVTRQSAKGTMDVFYRNDGSKHYFTYNLGLPWGFDAIFKDITFAKISLGSNLGDLTANTATSFQIPLITDAKVALQRPCSSSLLFNYIVIVLIPFIQELFNNFTVIYFPCFTRCISNK